MRMTLTGLLIVTSALCRAQQFLPDTAASRLAADQTVVNYREFMGNQARIYNGTEQIGYLPLVGHPYFMDDSVHIGSIVYEGVLYRDMPMLYDIVKDRLIITDSSHNLIGLSAERISDFVLIGHHFIQTPNGFRDVLISGPVTIWVKRDKRIEETIESLHVVRTVYEDDRYSAVIDGVEHPFGTLRSLLRLLKSAKKEIQRDLRGKGIKYKKDPERAIRAAAKYYNDHYPKAN
ncbi:MAG: hypothetical protein Q8937_03935 [Bacteroidota bacterium]|nr:hypothetical protein [Bacteroidota bacterium]